MKKQIAAVMVAAMVASLAQATDVVSASAGAGVKGEAEATAFRSPRLTLTFIEPPAVAAISTPDYKKVEIGNPVEQVTFSGGIAGNWLTVERHNTKAYDAKSFDPCYTSVISDFKPVPKKRSDGKWEVEFITELPKMK